MNSYLDEIGSSTPLSFTTNLTILGQMILENSHECKGGIFVWCAPPFSRVHDYIVRLNVRSCDCGFCNFRLLFGWHAACGTKKMRSEQMSRLQHCTMPPTAYPPVSLHAQRLTFFPLIQSAVHGLQFYCQCYGELPVDRRVEQVKKSKNEKRDRGQKWAHIEMKVYQFPWYVESQSLFGKRG